MVALCTIQLALRSSASFLVTIMLTLGPAPLGVGLVQNPISVNGLFSIHVRAAVKVRVGTVTSILNPPISSSGTCDSNCTVLTDALNRFLAPFKVFKISPWSRLLKDLMTWTSRG